MKHALPDLPGIGDIAKAVDPMTSVVRQAAAPSVFTEAMIPGLVAEGIKMGYSFPRIMKRVQGEMGTGLKNLSEEDIERMYYNLFDPYSATNMSGAPGLSRTPGGLKAGDAWRSMTGVENAFGTPFSQLRQSMSSVRKADPELYQALKDLSRDIEQYGDELYPWLKP